MSITNPQGKLILTEGSTNYKFNVTGTTLSTTGVATNQLVTSGLVSWWRLEENNNSVDGILDHAYTSLGVGANPGNHGTKFGTSTPTTGPTNGGNGLVFSGDDYIYLANSSILSFERTDTFSLGLWFNHANTGNFVDGAPALGKRLDVGPFSGYALYLSESSISGTKRITMVMAGTSGSMFVYINDINMNTYADGLWHNIFWTYDGSSTAAGNKLYFDGVSHSTTNFNDPTVSSSIINSSIFSIYENNGSAGVGTVSLDEVLVYNTELTAGQVLQNYNYYQ